MSLCPNGGIIYHTDVYRFMRPLLLIATLSAYGISTLLQKCFPMPMILIIFSTFSFFRFRLYSLLLISFTHLELSFILGDRYGCICIHLHTTIQFDTIICWRFCFVCNFQFVCLDSFQKTRLSQIYEHTSGSLIPFYDQYVCFYANTMKEERRSERWNTRGK